MVDLKKGQKVALYVTIITLALVIGKYIIGKIAGSTALIADAVHSAADSLVIFAAWFGLLLARRKTSKRFPYGLYRAETIAAFIISGLIIYAGIILFMKGLKNLNIVPEIEFPFLAMGTASLSAVISLILSIWEKKIGKEINSQSLIANSDESKMDFFSSLLVFFAVLGSSFQIRYIESILTISLSFLILLIGMKNGFISLLALLDIAPNIKLIEEIKKLVITVADVKGIENIKLRQAGPVLFGEADLKLAKFIDVDRAHEISHKVQNIVKSKFLQIEIFTTHIEPYQDRNYLIMVPIKGKKGINSTISRHFGKANYFAFVKMNNGNFKIGDIEVNSFKNKKVRAGLEVAKKYFQNKGTNILITKEIGEIGFHALRDYFVDIYKTNSETLRESLEDFVKGNLEKLEKPTHESEVKI